jgi:hypothetical protein
LLEILFNPKLAMVEVLTEAFILSHEKTFTYRPIANVSDDDFVGIDRFTTSQTDHGRTASGLKEIRGDAIRRIGVPPHSRKSQYLKNALFLSLPLSLKTSIKRRCGSDGLQVRPDGTSLGRRFQLFFFCSARIRLISRFQ